ncbi:MAG TPA: VTT domain-containing protein [Terriglobales bacterium]|nr:VTT domain-containing protein [Terriglobales bacterium]
MSEDFSEIGHQPDPDGGQKVNDANSLMWNGYLVFFGWILANRLGVPLPATPALLAAGALSAFGELRYSNVLMLAILATVISDSVWYELGKRHGGRILRYLCRISLQPDSCVRRAEGFLATHGLKSLLVTKFLPGMNRTILPLTGVVHVSYPRFFFFDVVGAALWAAVYSGLGFAFSEQFELALRHAKSLGIYGAIALAVLLGVGYAGYKFAVRKRLAHQLQMERISVDDLSAMMERGENVAVVDLRHPMDYLPDPRIIPGALRIEPKEFEERHEEIPRDREIILYCT